MHAIALLCAYMAFICGCMAVYIVGYAIMAYGIGLRDRRVAMRWDRRVWSVVCTVCIR